MATGVPGEGDEPIPRPPPRPGRRERGPAGFDFSEPTLQQRSHLAFARGVKAAGMDPSVVVPHVMRHTAITRLAASGADIKTIQEFAGHECLAMVLRYAHARDHVVDGALDRLERGTVVELPKAKTEQKS